ncbi:MAG TPA: hypothetical protein VFG94_01640, partial [Acidimicrobiales bacterium]|nr:hypothetical protein [Acidimicrobiales bacterium]
IGTTVCIVRVSCVWPVRSRCWVVIEPGRLVSDDGVEVNSGHLASRGRMSGRSFGKLSGHYRQVKAGMWRSTPVG